MNKVLSFLNQTGFENEQELTEEKLKKLKEEAEQMDLTIPKAKTEIIWRFLDYFGEFFLAKWQPHFPKYNEIDIKLMKKVQTFIYSVSIEYQGVNKGFHYVIDETHLENSIPNFQIEKEKEVLEFLFAGWAISSYFLERDAKKENAKKILVDSVRKIVEEKNFGVELYTKLPELIKNQIFEK